MPVQFAMAFPHPLAYIEWFTPLGRPDGLTGMHVVSRSTRAHRRNVGIVSVNRIIQSCHLVGKSGLEINHEWTMDNVLDIASQFYLNTYIDVDTFMVFRC